MNDTEWWATEESEPESHAPTRTDLTSQILARLSSIEESLGDLRETINNLEEELQGVIGLVIQAVGDQEPDDPTPPATNQRLEWTGEIDEIYLSGAHIDERRLQGNEPSHRDAQRRVIAWNDLNQEERNTILSQTWSVDRATTETRSTDQTTTERIGKSKRS